LANDEFMLDSDNFRNDFIETEHNLWLKIQNVNNEVNKHSESDILNTFHKFGNEIEKIFPLGDLSHLLRPIKHLYTWTTAYSEILVIRSQYNNFRRFQRQQSNSSLVHRQAWLELAEYILNDERSSVVMALDGLTRVNKRLFKSARIVY